ncbi:hypothetical protein EG352_19855 [Chryseobacterium indologenes]|uniref:Uncharacterized protein n=1 Tax=Chryseobacterium indologenes TaxID=253 RepID=A0AAD0YYF6_CHRID|nr:hypothetical protein [Chryseobacterium indologenes]ASE64065.1 hypothetical protein CEQ15_22665 [Chryseobacterium indologenes]AZB19853.1 hypothetical protein EG352_19855 [Chryseobacterium indologenes]
MKVSILEAKFRRSKLELNYTSLWKSLEVSKQNIILNKINLLTDEIPIISLYLNDLDWWLITNQHIYNYDNFLSIINVKEILKIEIPGKIKFLDENYINIYYEEKMLPLKLEQKSWIIISEIIRSLTHLNIIIDK